MDEFCMIVARRRGFFSTKVSISVDYGQRRSIFSSGAIKDSQGKTMTFNSVIDVLNHMAEQGWEYVNAYPLRRDGANVLHYIMKRTKISIS